MLKVYEGKTKDVYDLEDGNYLLKFKDTVTGKDGVFDPGANEIGLTIDGMGKASLRFTKYFFEKLNAENIPTHFISCDIEKSEMKVKPAKMFGKGVEVILRLKAVGSFIRRYGLYAKDGEDLPEYVEVTLKDDERNDPLITKDALEILGIMTKEEYEILKDLTIKIGRIIQRELAQKDMELFDIKFEFGRIGKDNHIALIDEISGGNMRVYSNGEYIEPMELERRFFK
ncbi:MAG: phosphoribosylaminoimidazolesuccinocarboxamide synthase [Tissierellia bacterium]|nr:phosphoribosylaminoimidazolesuccinocarboxamide synthase [Tissierellia bacterium]